MGDQLVPSAIAQAGRRGWLGQGGEDVLRCHRELDGDEQADIVDRGRGFGQIGLGGVLSGNRRW